MAAKDFIVHLDMNKQQLLNAALQNLAVHPSTTSLPQGFIYWNTADKTAYVYTGSTNPTWLDLGALYTHPSYNGSNAASSTLSGAKVISRVTLTNGHVTGITTRDLTIGDLGGATASHEHQYDEVVGMAAKTILANDRTTSGAAKAITVAQFMDLIAVGYGTASHLTTGTSEDFKAFTPKQISDFVNAKVSALVTASNLSLGNRSTTSMTINNSNGSGVTLPSSTTAQAGLISSADKKKLDDIEANANNYTHPSHSTANEASSALSGLDVISRIAVATNGHVTTIGKRTITGADLIAVLFDNATASTTKTWSSSKINQEILNAIDQAQTGGLQYKGEYNATTDTPDITGDSSVKTGFTYVVEGTGTFAGHDVEAGDMIIARVDNPGSTTSNWQVVNKNIPAIVNASTTVRGIVELATNTEALAGTDTSRAVTPRGLKYTLDNRFEVYTESFGDGASTHFDITHGLGSSDVMVQIRRASTGAQVVMDDRIVSDNAISIDCNIAPSSGEYQVRVMKVE